MQGFDSVAIAKKYGACDVELGGNDQYFNLLAGRTLMEAHGMPKQDIMTFDLLVGSDGKKMSKTSPNTVAIDEAPQSMYQKLINIQDDLIVKYFELATDASLEEVEIIRKRLDGGEHPNTLKIELAQRIITMYHGKPYDANDISNVEVQKIGVDEMMIGELLKVLGFAATSGDVRNALTGKSVRIDSEVIEDPKYLVKISSDGTLVEMGKKKAKRVFI
jgi:tyrosyl-tRNA synthetase